ncbi:MAG: coproporphyrinogen dehydrogenase HemZ [Clostridia bacterium]|nr:coproporphyrinogen dehydrogenase HemZ [Clostridia bacterium]
MTLAILSRDYQYETEKICRIFFPNEKINLVFEKGGVDEKDIIETNIDNGTATVFCFVNGKRAQRKKDLSQSENKELEMGRLLYSCLTEITGYTPPWGVLTGVRPSKLMTKYINEYGEREAKRRFIDELYVSEKKTALAADVSKTEFGIINLSEPDSFSLYVSIPFCPSRCSYCSFVSHSITTPAAKKLMPEYLDRLCDELEQYGEIASRLNLKIESIYFGGGTPGVLESSQLDRLCLQIENSFDLSTLREYTVEIGRPDTVTMSKLRTLKFHNVGRISINPQTFSQNILDAVGRQHTVEQTLSAYRMAKTAGFDSINMDLIAGLTGDTAENFSQSVDTAITLAPENITVHSLALKRSSELAVSGADVEDGETAVRMLDCAQSKLYESGYIPYYMYRQSKCVGNLENVGWCLPGKECLYNVFMMEECHTVFAAGAGAVTKLKAPDGDFIERIFNFKYPYEYISRFDELTDRKESIIDFYKEHI